AVTAHAVHRLQVVLVVDVRLGAGIDSGDVEGKAHLVFLQDHPGAIPGLGYYLAFGCFTVFQVTYDHVLVIPQDALCCAPAAMTLAKAASRMVMALSICSSLMISGHRHLTTWLWLPLVSMTSPRSKASAQMAAAVSPSGQLMPIIMPRPLTNRESGPWRRTIFCMRSWISAPLALTLSANSVLVQKCSSAAVAVTKAWLLPRKVPLCSPGSHWSSSRRMTTTAKGRPKPLRDLDRVMMSGLMPISSKLKKVPVRPQPAWMSSTMSSMSCLRQSFSSLRIQSADAAFRPPSPWTTSTITAAGLSTPLLGSLSSLSIIEMVLTLSPK